MKSVFNAQKVELGLKAEREDVQAVGTWKRHSSALKALEQSEGYQVWCQYFQLHKETIVQQMIEASKNSMNSAEMCKNMIFFLNGFEQSVKLLESTVQKLDQQIEKYEAVEEVQQYARHDE